MRISETNRATYRTYFAKGPPNVKILGREMSFLGKRQFRGKLENTGSLFNTELSVTTNTYLLPVWEIFYYSRWGERDIKNCDGKKNLSVVKWSTKRKVELVTKCLSCIACDNIQKSNNWLNFLLKCDTRHLLCTTDGTSPQRVVPVTTTRFRSAITSNFSLGKKNQFWLTSMLKKVHL